MSVLLVLLDIERSAAFNCGQCDPKAEHMILNPLCSDLTCRCTSAAGAEHGLSAA